MAEERSSGMNYAVKVKNLSQIEILVSAFEISIDLCFYF